MSGESRVKCERCDRMILPVTVQHYGGLCGVCYKNELTRPERLVRARERRLKSGWKSLLLAFVTMVLAGVGAGLLVWFYCSGWLVSFWVLVLPLGGFSLIGAWFGAAMLWVSMSTFLERDECWLRE